MKLPINVNHVYLRFAPVSMDYGMDYKATQRAAAADYRCVAVMQYPT